MDQFKSTNRKYDITGGKRLNGEAMDRPSSGVKMRRAEAGVVAQC